MDGLNIDEFGFPLDYAYIFNDDFQYIGADVLVPQEQAYGASQALPRGLLGSRSTHESSQTVPIQSSQQELQNITPSQLQDGTPYLNLPPGFEGHASSNRNSGPMLNQFAQPIFNDPQAPQNQVENAQDTLQSDVTYYSNLTQAPLQASLRSHPQQPPYNQHNSGSFSAQPEPMPQVLPSNQPHQALMSAAGMPNQQFANPATEMHNQVYQFIDVPSMQNANDQQVHEHSAGVQPFTAYRPLNQSLLNLRQPSLQVFEQDYQNVVQANSSMVFRAPRLNNQQQFNPLMEVLHVPNQPPYSRALASPVFPRPQRETYEQGGSSSQRPEGNPAAVPPAVHVTRSSTVLLPPGPANTNANAVQATASTPINRTLKLQDVEGTRFAAAFNVVDSSSLEDELQKRMDGRNKRQLNIGESHGQGSSSNAKKRRAPIVSGAGGIVIREPDDAAAAAATSAKPKPIKNSLYDPKYEEEGLPVDPHLRIFVNLNKN